MSTVGFALVTYEEVDQTADLIRVLDATFDRPPISLHHDHTKSPFERSLLRDNVQQIPERYVTGWGTVETSLAMLATIRHLMRRPDAPEWFFLLTSH